jgi:hypothetical protein
VLESYLNLNAVNLSDLHEFDLLENLQAVQGQLLKFMQTDYVLRWFIVHVDLLIMIS